jgi:hypothetical protein
MELQVEESSFPERVNRHASGHFLVRSRIGLTLQRRP